MKIYCVLFDAMPYEKYLEDFSKRRNLEFHHQVSNCFTGHSIFSLLTGLLPSQAFKEGWGYHSDDMILDNPSFNILDKMDKNNWDFYAHNATWLELVLYNKINFIKSTGLAEEYSGAWANKEIEGYLCSDNIKSKEITNREISHIKKIQSSKTEKNQFHFIIYHHHHAAICSRLMDYKGLDDNLHQIIQAWDFDEEDSIFWFFSDHGDFTKIDKHASPPYAWTTWVISKNNVTKNKSEQGLISILDFIPSFHNELGVEIPIESLGRSIYTPLDKDRTFFLEDSRANIDLYKSTTACAINCKEWDNNYPSKIEQTSYHLIDNSYTTINFNYKNRQVENGDSVYIDKHKEKMKNIFKWIQ